MNTSYLSWVFHWWIGALDWLRAHGTDAINGAMMLSCLALPALFVVARIRESLWQDNPINVAQYHDRGISFTPRMSTRERLESTLALIVIAVIVLVTVILPALA
jgi:hypothetical protein